MIRSYSFQNSRAFPMACATFETTAQKTLGTLACSAIYNSFSWNASLKTEVAPHFWCFCFILFYLFFVVVGWILSGCYPAHTFWLCASIQCPTAVCATSWLTVRGFQVISTSSGIRTRSQRAREPEQCTSIPVLVKIFKLLINELSSAMERDDGSEVSTESHSQSQLLASRLADDCWKTALALSSTFVSQVVWNGTEACPTLSLMILMQTGYVNCVLCVPSRRTMRSMRTLRTRTRRRSTCLRVCRSHRSCQTTSKVSYWSDVIVFLVAATPLANICRTWQTQTSIISDFTCRQQA